jgi:hypothetical protein
VIVVICPRTGAMSICSASVNLVSHGTIHGLRYDFQQNLLLSAQACIDYRCGNGSWRFWLFLTTLYHGVPIMECVAAFDMVVSPLDIGPFYVLLAQNNYHYM